MHHYHMISGHSGLRAINIEVALSLDTDSFVDTLKRCISRRGKPLLMRSHNGGNFVKAEKELWETVRDWNQSKIHDSLLARNIKWIFNPPARSHHGGVWERYIRSVRKVMKALTKEQPLDDKGLCYRRRTVVTFSSFKQIGRGHYMKS